MHFDDIGTLTIIHVPRSQKGKNGEILEIKGILWMLVEGPALPRLFTTNMTDWTGHELGVSQWLLID